MAFEKKPLNYEAEKELVEYSIGLEDRIEDEFDKLSVDFIVSQGNGWRRWNSGVQECWGRKTGVTDSSGRHMIDFPVSFNNTDYSFVGQGEYSTVLGVAVTVETRNTNSCRVFITNASGATINSTAQGVLWKAIGTWE